MTEAATQSAPATSAARVNVPNALSLLRLLGTPALFGLAQLHNPLWVALWFGLLGLTDALDGFLARRWQQASEFGSRLDGIADIAFYPSGAVLLLWLYPGYLWPNMGYMAVALALFVVSNLYARLRFGRFILLHTNLGRWSGVLAFFAVLGAFFTDTTILIRLTLLGYAISFVECLLIFKLRGPVSPDTRSVFSA